MPPNNGPKIKLGGKVKTLRYTQPALMRLEDERGGEALSETLQRAAAMSSKALTALVWAGRLYQEPELTIEEAAAQIGPPFMPALDAIVEALKPWIEQPSDSSEAS